MPRTPTRDILVTSDHHAGASYSTFRHQIEELVGRLSELNANDRVDERICVFNGDMFEVEEGMLDKEMMMYRAILMMERYMDAFPNVHFVYVLGNHEDYRLYHERLEALAARHPDRLSYSPDDIQIDDILFTHGDLPITSRGKFVSDPRLPGGRIERIEQGFRELDEGDVEWVKNVKLFLKGIITPFVSPLMFPIKHVIDDVYRAYSHHADRFFSENGVRHVVFGHVHTNQIVSGVQLGGLDDLQFHVSGCGVNGNPNAAYRFSTRGGQTRSIDVFDLSEAQYMDTAKVLGPDHAITKIIHAYEQGFFRDASVGIAA